MFSERNRFDQYRTLLDMNQQETADYLGVSLAMVKHWTSGRRPAPELMIQHLENLITRRDEAIVATIKARLMMEGLAEETAEYLAGGAVGLARYDVLRPEWSLGVANMNLGPEFDETLDSE